MPFRILICVLCLVAGAIPAFAELPPPVLARLRAAGLPEDAMGVVVQRLSDGNTLVAHGAERSMQPASTLKLLTSIVALESLGPAFRGRTELRTRGEVVDGVLNGSLVLRGGGDVDFDWEAFERMLRVLRLQGVRVIEGDLVLDRSLFNPARTDVGLAPFDAAPEFRYNFIPDALLLNTNLVQLDLVSDDSSVRIAMTPQLEGVTIASDFKLVERGCDDWEDGWVFPAVKESRGRIAIRLQGDFPKRCTASTSVNVIDRVVFADRLFRALWGRLGGTFRGRTREGQSSADDRLFESHRSRSLAELTRDINKDSDNPITRVIYLMLGALSLADPDLPTAQRAERVVREWMARKAIDPKGLVLENGSGLSRKERIRPAQLAAVLRAAAGSEWAPEFLASLPIVAVDGAMRRRLRDSAAAERGRIKTGTLRDVSAIAGYVKDDGNETYLVVAMVNHELAVKQVARPILDALVEWVADSKGRAGTRP
jgi:D-alanyl-D-alanine carboxypeptidase/D-alanyl-D-alanine-endopeptidase (penicillin-binding protein 4)